mmetsp:Transcript_55982/g.155079  ORF Transcript_55982/g.155079 Transcript_55982/m.155079 type:complete len:307 (+) Transcript_55982:168-1088(+)
MHDGGARHPSQARGAGARGGLRRRGKRSGGRHADDHSVRPLHPHGGRGRLDALQPRGVQRGRIADVHGAREVPREARQKRERSVPRLLHGGRRGGHLGREERAVLGRLHERGLRGHVGQVRRRPAVRHEHHRQRGVAGGLRGSGARRRLADPQGAVEAGRAAPPAPRGEVRRLPGRLGRGRVHPRLGADLRAPGTAARRRRRGRMVVVGQQLAHQVQPRCRQGRAHAAHRARHEEPPSADESQLLPERVGRLRRRLQVKVLVLRRGQEACGGGGEHPGGDAQVDVRLLPRAAPEEDRADGEEGQGR